MKFFESGTLKMFQLTPVFFHCVILPGWTSDLRLSVQEHQTAEVHCKLQQHRQHRVQIEYVW